MVKNQKTSNKSYEKPPSRTEELQFMEQDWVGKYVTQHRRDPEIALASYQCQCQWRRPFKTSINTKKYRKEKLQESVVEINCRVCSNDQETVSHILCGSSNTLQGQT